MTLPPETNTAGLGTRLSASEPASAVDAERKAASKSGIFSTLGSRLRLVWPIACLFQLGLIGGLYFSWIRHSSATDSPTATAFHSSRSHDSAKIVTSDGTDKHANRLAVSFESADELLRQGRYDQALTGYTSSNAAHALPIPRLIRFKTALCLEGLGQWDRAIAEFAAVASLGERDSISVAAQLAQARLWLRMARAEESKQILRALLLNSPANGQLRQSIISECSYLLALAQVIETLGMEPPSPTNDSVLALGALDWRPESLLNWTESKDGVPSDESALELANDDWIKIQRSGPTIEEWDAAVSTQRVANSKMIERIANAAGLSCDWTDSARELAAEKTTELKTGTLALPVLLECLTEPHEIAWEIADGSLRLFTYGELDDVERSSFGVRRARRTLLAATRDRQPKSLLAAAYLALGNLAAAEARPVETIASFERLIEEIPRSPHTSQAHFNIGIVRRSTGDFAAARQSLYRVVDGSPSHVLTPLSYLMIGRFHLDEGDPAAATVPLRRAAAAGVGTDVRPAAAIDLATALLLDENPRVANAIVLEHRTQLDQPPYRATAAFLATYTRYCSITDRKQRLREGQTLLSALMGLDADSIRSPAGILLIGRAYRDLGLSEQMAATFEQALQRGVTDRIAAEMSYELAEFALSAGRQDDAIARFTSVFGGATCAMARRAGVRLAELALAERRTDSCLNVCRKLLADAGASDTARILLLMGTAFEQAGDHRQAALCFSGQLPAQ